MTSSQYNSELIIIIKMLDSMVHSNVFITFA